MGEWDVVPLHGCHCSWGKGDQLWGSGRGAIAGFLLYIDNSKIIFCYLGSMLVYFLFLILLFQFIILTLVTLL